MNHPQPLPFTFVFVLGIRAWLVDKTALKLIAILLPQLPKCRDYKYDAQILFGISLP